MAWLEGLTRNWAELAHESRDPRLRLPILPMAPAETLRRAAEVLGRLPRWSIVANDPSSRTLHATRTSRVLAFRRWHPPQLRARPSRHAHHRPQPSPSRTHRLRAECAQPTRAPGSPEFCVL